MISNNDNTTNNNNHNVDDMLGNLLNLLSVVLAIKNLELNEQQVNALDAHLQKQDNEYLSKSVEQNAIIIEQNKEIIALLKKLR